MNKNLTIKLDSKIIEKARLYAKSNGTSLSKLIETYLDILAASTENENELESSPLVESLCGVIELPEDFNHRIHRSKHLAKKWLVRKTGRTLPIHSQLPLKRKEPKQT